ncbi:MAG: phosphatase PAP2 family protein [Dermatophilus congolensis]|nr:phosphatase PAP2 family protein [Dermatophilus congolensis]
MSAPAKVAAPAPPVTLAPAPAPAKTTASSLPVSAMLPLDLASVPAASVAGVGLLAAACALGGFVTGAGATATGELALDVTISAHRDPVLVGISHAVDIGVGVIAAPLWVLVISMVIGLAHRRAGVAFAVVSAVGWLSAGAAKLLFQRAHPPMSTVHALSAESGLTSFPSGHTAIAASTVAAAVVAARLLGRSTRWIWVLGVPFVAFVAATRLYIGVHYLGDVVASPLFVAGTTLLLVALGSLWCSRAATRVDESTQGATGRRTARTRAETTSN